MATSRRYTRGYMTALLGMALLSAPGCKHAETQDRSPGTDGMEMVNVGYGERPADEVAGAVSALSPEEWGDAHVVQLEELLRSRMAGIQVLPTPSGGFAIRIRGTSSIYGSNEPLYVMDGMPMHVDPDRGIDWLNLADIVRIDVLKDASATAIYGMRGANGVVLITTRRGRQEGDSGNR